MSTTAFLTRANPYLLSALRALRAVFAQIQKFRSHLAWVGSLALAAGVLALIVYLVSEPDTAPARVMAWVTGTVTSLIAALFALAFLAAAAALFALGAGFPPSRWNIKGRVSAVRKYLAH